MANNVSKNNNRNMKGQAFNENNLPSLTINIPMPKVEPPKPAPKETGQMAGSEGRKKIKSFIFNR